MLFQCENSWQALCIIDSLCEIIWEVYIKDQTNHLCVLCVDSVSGHSAQWWQHQTVGDVMDHSQTNPGLQIIIKSATLPVLPLTPRYSRFLM